MAGGITRSLGTLVTIFAILFFLVGAGAAGYGAIDERENQDRTFSDPDRSDQNEALVVGGLATLAFGVLLLIVGLIMLGVGGSLRERAWRRDLQSATTENARSHTEAKKPTTQKQATETAQPAPPGSGNRGAIIGVLIVVALLALGLMAWVLATDDAGGVFGRNDPPEPTHLNGAVRNAVNLPLVGAQTADASDSILPFGPPEAVMGFEAVMEWEAADGGTTDLRMILERDDNGTWTEIDRAGSTSPVTITYLAFTDETEDFRFRVFPNSEGAVQEQAFTITVTWLV